MKIEYEVVFTSIDREMIVQKIKNLWWVCKKKNTLMKRTVFSTPSGWKSSEKTLKTLKKNIFFLSVFVFITKNNNLT